MSVGPKDRAEIVLTAVGCRIIDDLYTLEVLGLLLHGGHHRADSFRRWQIAPSSMPDMPSVLVLGCHLLTPASLFWTNIESSPLSPSALFLVLVLLFSVLFLY